MFSGDNVAGQIELVFWPAGVMHLPIRTHIEIAAAGGFDSLAVAPITAKRAMASGQTAADLVAQAAEHGIAFSRLDGVSTWAPLWYPTTGTPSANSRRRERFDFDVQETLDLAEALGISSIVAVGAFDDDALPPSTLTRCFADFCDDAARRDLHVELEFVSLWGIRNLPAAWEIISSADRINSSIMVDTWHLRKGTQDYERDMELLETIPRRYLRSVQLSDAPLRREAPTLADEVELRTFPGEGEIEISRMLATIMAKGCLNSVGPEIIGRAYSGLSPQEIGRRSGDSTRAALRDAAACLRL